MKKYIKAILIIITCFCMLLGLFMQIFLDKETIKTDCYNEYNNKIIGLKCEKEIYSNEFLGLISSLLIIFGVMFGFITIS